MLVQVSGTESGLYRDCHTSLSQLHPPDGLEEKLQHPQASWDGLPWPPPSRTCPDLREQVGLAAALLRTSSEVLTWSPVTNWLKIKYCSQMQSLKTIFSLTLKYNKYLHLNDANINKCWYIMCSGVYKYCYHLYCCDYFINTLCAVNLWDSVFLLPDFIFIFSRQAFFRPSNKLSALFPPCVDNCGSHCGSLECHSLRNIPVTPTRPVLQQVWQ